MVVIGAASIYQRFMHRTLELLLWFLDQDLSGNYVGILFSFYFFAFIMTQSNCLSELRGRMSASRARAGSSGAFSGKSRLFRGGDGDLSILAQPVISGIELVAHICNANKLCLGKVGETKMCLQVLSSGTSRCNTAKTTIIADASFKQYQFKFQ